ncbi:GntR family transcriptional regulator [Paenibacillus alba]|uniref:GntR family transcriptional regulator n=1 Tax=Paenibacillus alba TaxID=1197127 RepID=A0ABU6G5L2_9BACL|nr:GntR family transcriptional regulator [Paenibacillus alba]MEC0229462.1 GntR family transcriptional regulator [Paenibacillus alba]NQX70239.1 GntR family transcriptional regulator [Paenibacillus alba]
MEKKLLYLKVKEELERSINEGELKPGEKLPSEPELAKKFAVSRPTLREALKMLQREKVLISKNGVGTYVNTRSEFIIHPLSKLQSVGQMIKNQGFLESESDIKLYTREPEEDWKKQLLIDEPVVILERSRTANGNKVAFYYNIFPQSLVQDHLDGEFSGAIFDFLQSKMGIHIAYAMTEICALNNSQEMDQNAIEVLGSEIILLKQLHFDDNDKPIFYSLDYLKNSVFKFFIKRE